MVLYLPDQIIVVDTKKRDAWEMRYDFTYDGATTNWIARDGPEDAFAPCTEELSPEATWAAVSTQSSPIRVPEAPPPL